MRKIYLTLITIAYSYTWINAQWLSLHADPVDQLSDIHFPTDNFGYVTGWDTTGAIVLQTTDAGVTWNRKPLPFPFLHQVWMTSSLAGYAIKGGVPVTLIRTTDGFNTWTTHTYDSSFIVQELEFVNDSVGLYLNNEGRLRRIKNYGVAYVPVFEMSPYQTFDFANSSVGYLGGGSQLARSVNGGTNWTQVGDDINFWISYLSFPFADTGYAASLNAIYKTVDGGQSFSPVLTFDLDDVHGFQNICMAVGDTGSVAYSMNMGTSWNFESSGMINTGAETFKLETSPNGTFYMISNAGEIRKRAPGLSLEDNAELSVEIFPNPATDQIRIRFEKPVIVNTTVYDLSGKKIVSRQNDGSQQILECTDWMPGIYIVEIEDESGNIVRRKLVKQ